MSSQPAAIEQERESGQRTAVYRFFDAENQLLYVGITNDVLQRWPWHAKNSEWWPLARRAEVVWRDSREVADAEETRAVRTESPIWNVSKRGETGQVSFRLDQATWDEFGAAAAGHKDGRSGVLRDFIRWYLSKPEAEFPQRPESPSSGSGN